MAQRNQLLQWLSAAGVGGSMPWMRAAAGSDTASAVHDKYRPDIDGLRALAVLPVVFYHLNISLVSGGFVGVDVFFVISGYLITGLISAEMAAGTYSIANFYVRRARRIFPALFFMCAVTALFVFVVCLPSDAKIFSGSLAAATLFASNFYFYATADYFAPGVDTQPLLHTWSLAVEEQFYILFPLILLLVRRRFGQREKQIMIALALLSLAISIWLVGADQAGAFYLLHSRAWELLLGALLAIGAVPAIRSRALANALGIAGLALIVGSVLLYTQQTPFPGLAALAPCIGAADRCDLSILRVLARLGSGLEAAQDRGAGAEFRLRSLVVAFRGEAIPAPALSLWLGREPLGFGGGHGCLGRRGWHRLSTQPALLEHAC